MKKYYKREVSLMDTKIFPRSSLDRPIKNPDPEYSRPVTLVEKSDEELVNDVVSVLKKTGTKTETK
jgi:hypothetical protein